MLKLDCPFCGARDEREFRCGGQSHITRPGPPAQVSDETWAAYLFLRDNPKGWHFERWLHAAGCRQWFNVARNTVTHEVRQVYAMTAPKPLIDPPGASS
jgi:heterotetrameric sarcosine oxidase delta subunit